MSRLEEIKHYWHIESMIDNKDVDWIIQQAERVEELERRNEELEYASRYNGELNEFLQRRSLPPNTLGRHVVDVVMDYVEELEKDNKRLRDLNYHNNLPAMRSMHDEIERYKQALEKITTRKMSQYLTVRHMNQDFIKIANEALKEE